MDTAALKKFSQTARRSLLDQISNKMKATLAPDSLARRESAVAVAHLESLIKEHSQEYVIERVAYTWFNRFSALRFMDVNHYNPICIVSPVEGQSQPEILAGAKAGHIDSELVPASTRQKVNDLLSNRTPSANPQAEAYRLLLVATCNYWNQAMPFLFEKIADYTELLIPDDLLSDQSILAQLRSTMTLDDCADVEIIGWLYQFYISEKKDEVFDGLKKNKKINPENIPAATQLFTPHWIVRYLVENSLGRLWMLNHPKSSLVAQMAYYIKPEAPDKDFLKINSPEEIKICDPACGSGHMLVYAFDLLYVIYEEEGYDTSDIPAKILTNNLYGIEIDERAGELAAFALTMRARSKKTQFFRQQVRPNICVLENVKFDSGELKSYMSFVGRDLFTIQLQNTLHQFEEVDNFGSLICPELSDVKSMLLFLQGKNIEADLLLRQTHVKILKILEQVEFLRSMYDVVIANPPYMGNGNMNNRLSEWIRENFPKSKLDLFAAFVERSHKLVKDKGLVAMITMQSWMFRSTYSDFRNQIINHFTVLSLLHIGARGFDSIGGEVVATVAFISKNFHDKNYTGDYIRVVDGTSEDEKILQLNNAIIDNKSPYRFKSSSNDFIQITGSPIVYWATKKILQVFSSNRTLAEFLNTREGLTTGDNNKFLRYWHEVSIKNIGDKVLSNTDSIKSGKRWFKYVKGGSYRKWSGNFEYIVNWYNDGIDLKSFIDPLTSRIRSHNYNGDFGFLSGLSWSSISSANFAVRFVPQGFMFDTSGPMGFSSNTNMLLAIIGYLNSRVATEFMKMLSPTLDFKLGHVLNLPFKETIENYDLEHIKTAIDVVKNDWDSYETSFDFKYPNLVCTNSHNDLLKELYINLSEYRKDQFACLLACENHINSSFVKSFGLDNEIDFAIGADEITLNGNPYYRYGPDKTEAELESLLLADTMREFMSFAVGCMFGRYSLDKPGLILANQAETIDDYLAQIPSPTFMADEDNVIPILDGDWFADDIVERFRQFLRITFGDVHFSENLQFIEDAIGKDIRSFFLKDFYNDHIKRYKKRPIYWLFSSTKGTFNALIYMHRYRPDMASIVLNKYLRELKVKLSARMEYLSRIEVSANASKSEKTHAIKERETLKKNLDELDAWERDVLYPLALEQKEIDLDDGVKVNYPKFGLALKKIPGLDSEED